jgi:hypothetical protein
MNNSKDDFKCWSLLPLIDTTKAIDPETTIAAAEA